MVTINEHMDVDMTADISKDTFRPAKFSGTTVTEFDSNMRDVRRYLEAEGLSYLLDTPAHVPIGRVPVLPAPLPAPPREPAAGAAVAARNAFQVLRDRYDRRRNDWNQEMTSYKELKREWEKRRRDNERAKARLANCFEAFQWESINAPNLATAHQCIAALRGLFTTPGGAGLALSQWFHKWHTTTLPYGKRDSVSAITAFVKKINQLVDQWNGMYPIGARDGELLALLIAKFRICCPGGASFLHFQQTLGQLDPTTVYGNTTVFLQAVMQSVLQGQNLAQLDVPSSFKARVAKQLKQCKVHGPGSHSDSECRMQKKTDGGVKKMGGKKTGKGRASFKCPICSTNSHDLADCYRGKKIFGNAKAKVVKSKTKSKASAADDEDPKDNEDTVVASANKVILKVLPDPSFEQPLTPSSKMNGYSAMDVQPDNSIDDTSAVISNTIANGLLIQDPTRSGLETMTMILDSGATSWMTPRLDLFRSNSYVPIRGPSVEIASGKQIPVIGYGEVVLDLGNGIVKTIKNALHVPTLRDTLASVSGLIGATADEITFDKKYVYFHSPVHGKRTRIGRKEGDLYVLYSTTVQSSPDGSGLNEKSLRGKALHVVSLDSTNTDSDTYPVSIPTVSTKRDALAMTVTTKKSYIATLQGMENLQVTLHSLQPTHATSLKLFSTAGRLFNSGLIVEKSQDMSAHDLLLLHKKFGHINPHLLSKSGIVEINKLPSSLLRILSNCEVCAKHKVARLPVRPATFTATRYLFRIHTDVIPLPKESPTRKKYWQLLIDEFTRWIYIRLLRHKSEVLISTTSFILDQENRSGLHVAEVRSDVGELVSNTFLEFCANKQPPITYNTSPPYTKEFNGLAERNIRTVKETTECQLDESHLPDTLYSYSVSYAAYIKNRLWHPFLKMSPFEARFGFKPDLTKIHPFGCLIYVHLSKEERQRAKTRNQGEPAIFLGFKGEESKIVICFSLRSRRTLERYHVVFQDQRFPGLTRHPDQIGSPTKPDDPVLRQTLDVTDADTGMIPVESLGGTSPTGALSEDERYDSAVRGQELDSLERNLGEEDEMYLPDLHDMDEDEPIATRLRRKAHLPKLSKELGEYFANLAASSDIDLPTPAASAFPVERIRKEDLPSESSPTTFKEAMSGKYGHYWLAGCISEMNTLISKDTWVETVAPPRSKVIKGRWVFTYRFDEDNFVHEFKSRWVARGFTETKGIDYTETYAPVSRVSSIRLMLCMFLIGNYTMRQIDVKGAFLNAPMDRVCYVELPEGFKKTNAAGEEIVCELLKALYGLHVSPRLWYQTYRNSKVEQGWKRSNADPCIFVMYDPVTDSRAVSSTHVDDLFEGSDKVKLLDRVTADLNAKYQLRVSKDVKFSLSIQLEQTDDGIWIGQPTYAKEILVSAGLWENTSTKPTPMMTSWTHDLDSPSLSKEKSTFFRSYLMKIAHLANQTRPDLSCSCNLLAQYQVSPTESDWKALERILRYLRETFDLGLYYSRKGIRTTFLKEKVLLVREPENYLMGYSDASYGGTESNERRSQSGYVFLICGAAVSWSSQKQKSKAATSSTDAELYALHKAVKEAMWAHDLLLEIGVHGPPAIRIYQDNTSTIAIASNPVKRGRTRHIAQLQQFVNDAVERKDVELVFCPTADMVADIMTKPLPPPQFIKLREKLGLCSLRSKQKL